MQAEEARNGGASRKSESEFARSIEYTLSRELSSHVDPTEPTEPIEPTEPMEGIERVQCTSLGAVVDGELCNTCHLALVHVDLDEAGEDAEAAAVCNTSAQQTTPPSAIMP